MQAVPFFTHAFVLECCPLSVIIHNIMTTFSEVCTFDSQNPPLATTSNQCLRVMTLYAMLIQTLKASAVVGQDPPASSDLI